MVVQARFEPSHTNRRAHFGSEPPGRLGLQSISGWTLTSPPGWSPGSQPIARAGAAAGEELAQLALDETRKAVAAQTGLGEKGLEVMTHNAVQHRQLGLAADVGALILPSGPW